MVVASEYAADRKEQQKGGQSARSEMTVGAGRLDRHACVRARGVYVCDNIPRNCNAMMRWRSEGLMMKNEDMTHGRRRRWSCFC